MKSTYTSIKALPLTLNAREAAAVLRITKSKVYELARTEPFPAIRIGNRVVIPRNKLMGQKHGSGRFASPEAGSTFHPQVKVIVP